MKVTIYTLENPIDNSIFYVGRTILPLKSRLKAHIKEIYDGAKSIKRDIITNILDKKLTPIIEELEIIECKSVSDDIYCNKIELYWMNQLKSWGFNICNVNGNIRPTNTNNGLIKKYKLK